MNFPPTSQAPPNAAQDEYLRLLLLSYESLVGTPLMPPSHKALSERMWEAPFVLVAHGTEEDPLFCYGNAQALKLWELTWEDFYAMPSRYTAEEGERDDRARLLQDVSEKGFCDNYNGKRVSRSGRRFRISNATVFNLYDSSKEYMGQAATFTRWEYL